MRTRLNYWGNLLTCLIAVMLIIPGVSAQDTMESAESVSRPAVVIGECMNVLVKDATSVSDLESSGIVEPEDLKIPEIITRYDLVTFDHAALNREMLGVLSIQIHERDYSVALNRMAFENLDDGIDSIGVRLISKTGFPPPHL